MRKETLLQKIITWFLKKIGLLETREISKEEMCKRAVESGVCPRECDMCAWRVGE